MGRNAPERPQEKGEEQNYKRALDPQVLAIRKGPDSPSPIRGEEEEEEAYFTFLFIHFKLSPCCHWVR